jgi:hypothetical protein
MKKKGMWEEHNTGATLVDFVKVGAREVRGSLLYPRKYLVSNAYFDADVVNGIRLNGIVQRLYCAAAVISWTRL